MSVTPTPTGEPFELGDGTLYIGATGTPLDVSCLVNNAVIAAEKDEGDSTTKLCGTVRPGSVKYTYSLNGNMDTDVAVDSGFFALTQEEPGSEQSFTFVPSLEAATEASGTLVIDPLDFGGDEMGALMASDFEFTIVGRPTYTYGGGVVAEGADVEGDRRNDEDDYAVA